MTAGSEVIGVQFTVSAKAGTAPRAMASTTSSEAASLAVDIGLPRVWKGCQRAPGSSRPLVRLMGERLPEDDGSRACGLHRDDRSRGGENVVRRVVCDLGVLQGQGPAEAFDEVDAAAGFTGGVSPDAAVSDVEVPSADGPAL